MARPLSASVPGPPHSETASVLLQSSSLVTSGASCHFAAVRNSLISQLADIAALGSASIISSWHAHTTSIGHSDCLQGSRVMLLVQLVLKFPLIHGQWLTEIVTSQYSTSRLSLTRVHFTVDPVCVIAPHVGPLEKSSPFTKM